MSKPSELKLILRARRRAYRAYMLEQQRAPDCQTVVWICENGHCLTAFGWTRLLKRQIRKVEADLGRQPRPWKRDVYRRLRNEFKKEHNDG